METPRFVLDLRIAIDPEGHGRLDVTHSLLGGRRLRASERELLQVIAPLVDDLVRDGLDRSTERTLTHLGSTRGGNALDVLLALGQPEIAVTAE